MPRKPRYVLPTPGERYDGDDLDRVEPDARPNRPTQKMSGTGPRRRKQAMPRRSRERLHPDGGYFYWCEHCNYCNTPEDGRQARCPEHRATHEANRVHRRSIQQPPPVAGIDPQVFTAVRRSARDLNMAWKQLDIARRSPRQLERANHDLAAAIRALLEAVNRLPRPQPPKDS